MADIYGSDQYDDDDSFQWNGTYYEHFPPLIGTNSNDNIYGFNGFDILLGYGGSDYLDGGYDNDNLYGGYGNDTLVGWNGADWMEGNSGNDTYFVENTGDKVIEKLNEGTDTVNSKLTNYTLTQNVENLKLTGTTAINGTGNSQNNVITGNSATNQLNGGAGNDILDGRGSFDKLTGGVGNDIFKFTVRGPSDQINDYNVANDTIQLENSVFTKLTTGTLSASQFKVGAQAADANDFIIYNKPTGALLYDADGSGAGAATRIAEVNDGLNLTNADIFVI